MRTMALLCVLASSLASQGAAAQPGPPYPRLANVYWRTDVDETIIEALSRWDVVVLNPVWSNSQLSQLRAANPDIKIFFIVNAYVVQLPSTTNDVWKLANYAYAEAHDLWWYDVDAAIASDWPATRMVNVTSLAPDAPLGPWRDFFAARVADLVASRPQLDGLFLDNFWRQISWQQVWRKLDSDCNPTHNPAGCDGEMDSKSELDSLWNEALRELAAQIRNRFDLLEAGRRRPLAMITNNSDDYFQWLNGTMHEYFPSGHSNVDYDNLYGYNWYQEMFACPGGYMVAPFEPLPFRVSILNADYPGGIWEPARNPAFERIKRFALASSLLGDGYLSLDTGLAGHGNLWWEPEYDHDGRGKGYLGYPTGPAVRILEPRSSELLANPDFLDGSDHWHGHPFGAAGSWSIDAEVFHSAPGAVRLDVQSVSASGTFKLWQSPVWLTHRQTYTLGFWARASRETELLVHLYSETCPQSRCWGDRRFCVPTTWTRFETSFSSNATARAGLNFFVTAPGTLWIDDVSLRRGDTSLFRRDFDHGIVLLNYTNDTQVVPLETTFFRLRIPGSNVFDGTPVAYETVPPSDARILVREPASATTPTGSGPGVTWQTVLHPNEPNPFNPWTRIRFGLAREGHAHVAVYDVAGRLVRTLVDRQLPAGSHRARWDGSDWRGRRMGSGIYLYRLTAPGFTRTRKMVLVR
ncbi:MAG: putative glycoside hydrolase [Candidatus Krumholzibacteriia bacterium]